MQTFETSPCNRHELNFSPDGRYLLVGAGWPVLLDTHGAEPPEVLKRPDGRYSIPMRFVHGGTAVVYLTRGDACVYDLATKQVTVTHTGAGRSADALAVGPDGTTVYTIVRFPTGPGPHDWRSEVRAFDVNTWEQKAQYPGRDGYFPWTHLSANGRRLAGRSSGLWVWDLGIPDNPDLAVVSVPAERRGSPVEGFALSADGTRLACVTNRGVSLWATANGWPTATEVFRSGKHRRRVSAVACCPTKPLLATGDTGGCVFLWDHAGNVLTRYDWRMAEVHALAFAPDGFRCAASDAKGKTVVWDVDV